jgi:hypothetical protein
MSAGGLWLHMQDSAESLPETFITVSGSEVYGTVTSAIVLVLLLRDVPDGD